jgi:hypothetical protein
MKKSANAYLKTKHRLGWCVILTFLGGLLCGSGCQYSGSTTRRAGAVGLGAGAGALAGYAVGKDAVSTGIGAVAGGTLTHLAMGKDTEVAQEGFDKGYMQGQSDAIKRQYFLRQAQEQRPLQENPEVKYTTYTLPAPTETQDGRRLEPQTISVRVVE